MGNLTLTDVTGINDDPPVFKHVNDSQVDFTFLYGNYTFLSNFTYTMKDPSDPSADNITVSGKANITAPLLAFNFSLVAKEEGEVVDPQNIVLKSFTSKVFANDSLTFNFSQGTLVNLVGQDALQAYFLDDALNAILKREVGDANYTNFLNLTFTLKDLVGLAGYEDQIKFDKSDEIPLTLRVGLIEPISFPTRNSSTDRRFVKVQPRVDLDVDGQQPPANLFPEFTYDESHFGEYITLSLGSNVVNKVLWGIYES